MTYSDKIVRHQLDGNLEIVETMASVELSEGDMCELLRILFLAPGKRMGKRPDKSDPKIIRKKVAVYLLKTAFS